jgi:hypothetical protein
MSKNLKPAVAMGPWHENTRGYYGPNSYVRARNQEFFANSRTKWIRIWVAWQYLFPYKEMVDPSQAPPIPDPNIFEFGENADYTENTSRHPIWIGMNPQRYVAHLDDAIVQARRAGLNIVLTIHQTPRWTNRLRRKGWGIPFSDGRARLVPPDEANFRDSLWRLSLDTNVGRLMRFLVTRYSIYKPLSSGLPRNVDWIEICNEPNHEWEPRGSGGGQIGAFPEVAAWFFKLGWKAAKDYGGGAPTIMGPALSDAEPPSNPTSTHLRRTYWRFMKEIFGHLRNGELIQDVPGAPLPARTFNEGDGVAGWTVC